MRPLLNASLRCPRFGLPPLRRALPSSSHATIARRCAHSRSRSAVAVAERPTEVETEYDPSDAYDPTSEHAVTILPGHHSEPEFHPPPLSAQEYPAAWAASIEQYLPLRLQTAHPRWPLFQKPESVRIEGLPALVLLARASSDVDVLANYGLREGRWEAMLWLADAILHVSKDRYTPNGDRAIQQSVQWPKRIFLDDWTDSAASMIQHQAQSSQETRRHSPSLDAYTFSRSSTSRIVPNRTVHKQLGSLWESIGELILTASSQAENDAKETMRYTLRLLGQMHYHGFIPSKVYNDPPIHNAPGIRQPSLLSEISPAIMSALLDASMDHGAGHHASGGSDPFIKPDIGPGLWMEFVLWCCVRGGWLIEASKILDSMRSRKGSGSWHLVCWQELESSPESTLADLLQRRSSASADALPSIKDGDFVKDFERTVSSEVVIALVDALTMDMHSRPGRKHPLQHTCDRLSQLREFLVRENMTLDGIAWDEVITRFVDNTATDLARSPEILESLLTSVSETYVSKHSVAGLQSGDVAYDDYTSMENATVLGFFHKALRASAELGDAFQALKTLKSLQDFTDTNKKQAIQAFFKRLAAPAGKSSTEFEPDSVAPSLASKYPAFFLSLPPTLLAELLDLWSEARMFDICRWIVETNTVEDPLITEDMYSDPVVAPALLRFALRSNDDRLTAKIRESAPDLMEAKSLISICTSQLEIGYLSSSVSILQLLKSLEHRWHPDQLASVLEPLLPLMVNRQGGATATDASSILTKLFYGDYGSAPGVEWLMAILATVSNDTASLCSPFLRGFKTLDIHLSVGAFERLLCGCVRAYGSTTGRKLWQTWCDSAGREIYIGEGAGEATMQGSKPAGDEFMAMQKQPTEPDQARHRLFVTGRVQPEITTLRIIMRQALEEVDPASGSNMEESSRQVLVWGENIYSEVYGFAADKIAKELSGYSSASASISGESRTAPYSKATVSIWQGVMKMKRSQRGRMSQTLRSAEREMRRLARGVSKDQATFAAISRVERKFVHQLALDLGMFAESFGREPKRGVVVSRVENMPEIPTWTIEEWLTAEG